MRGRRGVFCGWDGKYIRQGVKKWMPVPFRKKDARGSRRSGLCPSTPNRMEEFVMLRCLACIVVFVFLTGCATMFTSPTDHITFNSSPEGANVEINGMSQVKTPVTVPVKKSMNSPQVQMKKNGYEGKPVFLQTSFNAVSLLNIFVWPGFIVDIVTGKMWKYDPTTYNVELEAAK